MSEDLAVSEDLDAELADKLDEELAATFDAEDQVAWLLRFVFERGLTGEALAALREDAAQD